VKTYKTAFTFSMIANVLLIAALAFGFYAIRVTAHDMKEALIITSYRLQVYQSEWEKHHAPIPEKYLHVPDDVMAAMLTGSARNPDPNRPLPR